MKQMSELNAMREEKLRNARLIERYATPWVTESVACDVANRNVMVCIGRAAAEILFSRKVPRGHEPRITNMDSHIVPNSVGYLYDIVHHLLNISNIPVRDWAGYSGVFAFYIKKHSKKLRLDDENAMAFLGRRISVYPMRFNEDFRNLKIVF